MLEKKVTVLWNKKAGHGYYKIGLKCHKEYLYSKPGQFVMMRIANQTIPFLSRPFSIHNLIIKKKTIAGIEILYKVVGKFTTKLSMCDKGDCVDLLGPLGNGFLVPDNLDDLHNIFIIAGGIGVAPMFFLASYLQKKRVAPECVNLFLGGKTKADLLCLDEFSRFGIKLHIATDDGSYGDKCFVTDILETAIDKRRPDVIYGCGPVEMLKVVADIARTHTLPCQISIETVMACGLGVCLGCAIERKDSSGKYAHVCKDGPVFDTNVVKI